MNRNRLTQTLIALMLGCLAIVQVDSQCEDYCYVKESAFGKCTICYNDCEDSTQASFRSCSILPINSVENQTLTEALCKQQCYPETYPIPTSQTPLEEEPSITLEQLQKLKQETEGWTSQPQRLIKATFIMLASSVLFIGGFVLVWREVDKRRKLKQLQTKQQKEWVKCFEKVNFSDTTICPIDSKQTTVVVRSN